ncbi:hypothetical protein Fmac_009277 [Flemingia macrophylla]|uniref:Uncharacterized protein n=1 Tax=Flemingia macrophylla TaxID=520843 RepID=A0ABD1MZT6_9FABA
MISSAQSVIPAVRRRRNHPNPGTAVVFRLRATRKKHYKGFPLSFRNGSQKSEVSARKLAAGLRHWRCMEVPGDVFRRASSSSKFQLESCLKGSKEDATKWNPTFNNEASNKLTMIQGMKHLEDKKYLGDCYFGVTNFPEDLNAKKYINKLKATQESSKKKVSKNLEDKKVPWKCRECQQIKTTLHGLRDKLARERRSRERMEVLNAKLVHDLVIANSSTKQFMTNYKKEKKERKLVEEVCNELAMQVREDTAKLETLLSDSLKIYEEVEEEREMMEMVELWREERVQMKLLDAQFLLEDKYNQMVQLITFLQMFLISRGAELDTTEDAQLIKQVVESVNIKQTVELSYDFSKFKVSTFEDLRKDNMKKRMIKCTPPNSPLSTIHIGSLDEEVLNSIPSSEYNMGLDLTNSSENFDYIKDQKFSSMPQKGDTYFVNSIQDILGSENTCLESLRKKVNGVGYVSEEVLRKASSTSKTLRSCPSGGIEISTTKTSQHKRLGGGWKKQKKCSLKFPSNSIHSVETTSHSQGSIKGSFNPSEQGNSTCNINPHIIRWMRGSTEWRQGVPKSNFKVTPFGK